MIRSQLLLCFCLASPCAAVPVLAQEDQAADASESTSSWISSVAWHSDDHLVGTRSQGLLLRPAEVVRVDASDLTATTTVGEAETSLWSVLPVGEGKLLAADYKGGIHVFGEEAAQAVECDTRWVRAMVAAPDGQEVVVGTEDGKLVVLSLDEKKEVRRAEAHAAAIFDVAFSPAGDQLATVGGDGRVKLFSWPALEPQGSMTRGAEAIWSVVYLPDGKHLVTGGADRRIQLWDLDSQSSVCTITQTSDWITDLAVLPDSPVVVAACMDGKLVVAATDSLQKVTEVDAAESAIWSLALHSDGKRIALGTRKNGFALAEVGDWLAQAEQLAQAASLRRPPAPKK